MFELKLENENANIVNLNDEKNYIIVPPLEGFAPPSASLFLSKSPNKKGAKHNGSTLNERSIIINVKLLGDIERNRNALYPWIDTEQYVKIYYRNGEKNVYCEGYIQDCNFDTLTNNEIVSIVITCGDPYLRDMQTIETEISNLLKQFTFSFAIDSAGVPFSTIRENNTTNIHNSGAETGVKIVIRCVEEVNNIMLFDANNTTRQFKLNGSFPAGWVIEIDTEASPKTCKAIKPDGQVENLMRYIGKNPVWFTLKKGYNLFGYSTESGKIEMTVSFTNKYTGV